MRNYAVVRPTFWTGETGRRIRALGPEAQVMALYLVTSPHANMAGLYYLPVAYAAHDIGSPFEGASKALRSLSEAHFAYFDEDTETVWIPEMARIQVGESLSPKDNRHKALVKSVEPFKKSPFFAHFVEKYREAFELPFEVETKDLANPFEAPSKPLRSQEQDQDQDQEQEQERGSSELPPTQGPGKPDPVRLVFDAWLEEHIDERQRSKCKLNGKRRSKIQARLREYPPERLIAAIRGVKRSPFHMGDNAEGKRWTDLAVILRDGEQVEKFEALLEAPPSATGRRRPSIAQPSPASAFDPEGSWAEFERQLAAGGSS